LRRTRAEDSASGPAAAAAKASASYSCLLDQAEKAGARKKVAGPETRPRMRRIACLDGEAKPKAA
jgi:hypothetical protein